LSPYARYTRTFVPQHPPSSHDDRRQVHKIFFPKRSTCHHVMTGPHEFLPQEGLPSLLKSVSAQILRCHILALLSVVKETIKAELPSKFSIVFDGWTEGTHHYIGIAAAYLKFGDGHKEEPVQTMLSMQPLVVDGIQGMGAQDHLDHVENLMLRNLTTLFVLWVITALSTNVWLVFWMFLSSDVLARS
jgi:hypothetical protein